MSGSPIIQDGKLVGAVTHVLVNDPTRGYGIFIENLLDAAELRRKLSLVEPISTRGSFPFAVFALKYILSDKWYASQSVGGYKGENNDHSTSSR